MPASAKKNKTKKASQKPDPPAREKPGDGREKKLIAAMAGIIFLCAVAFYLPGLKGGFIYDDKFHILRNPLVNGGDPWRNLFTTPFYQMGGAQSPYYRPWVNLSYRLDYQFWKENPMGYHLTNIILHSLVSVLVFLCGLAWLKNPRIAGAAGLLFALHPAHTQSVSWISGRTDLLSSLFALLAIYFYLRAQAPSGKWNLKLIGLSLLSFFLALFCKEVAVTVLILIALLDFGRLKKIRPLFQPRPVAIYAGGSGMILIYFLIRLRVLGFLTGYQDSGVREWYYQNLLDPSRAATVFKVYGYYLKTLIFPIQLCFESKMLVSGSWLDPDLIASVIAVLSLLAAGMVALKFWPELAIGGFWFFITLLPVSNIFTVRELAMEHLLYLPSIGLILALALVFHQVLEGSAGREKFLAHAVLLLVLLSYGVLTVSRQAVWKNEISFWQDAAWKAPLKRRPWYNLGVRLKDQGDAISAIRCWTLAEKAEPGDPAVHNNLGAAYFEMGDLDSAIAEFQECLRLNPNHSRARINLENVLRMKSQTKSPSP